MKTRRPFSITLILTAGSVLGAFLATPDHKQPFYRAILFFIVFTLVNWIWALLSLNGINLKREIRGSRHEVGQFFEERFEVMNSQKLALPWVEVLDKSALFGETGSRAISWLPPGTSRSYSKYALLTRRGYYQLGPTVLRSGDLFGLFQRTREISSNRTLLVMPVIIDIGRFHLPFGILSGGKAKRRKSFEITPLASSVREYAHGDPINRIHWASTARRGRLISKEYDHDPMSDVWILLDANKNAHFIPEKEIGSSEIKRFWLNDIQFTKRVDRNSFLRDTFEYSVTSASSLSKFMTMNGLALGFVCSGQQNIALAPEKGERQLNKVLEVLALVQPVGTLPLTAVVEGQIHSFSRGCTVIIITASSSDQVVIAAKSLAHRNIHPMITLISRQSFGSDEYNPQLIHSLRQSGIPAAEIAFGDDLQMVLETGYTTFAVAGERRL